MGFAIEPQSIPHVLPKSRENSLIAIIPMIITGRRVIANPVATQRRPSPRIIVSMNWDPASMPRHARNRERPMLRSIRFALRVV